MADPPTLTPADLGDRRHRRKETAIRWLFLAAAWCRSSISALIVDLARRQGDRRSCRQIDLRWLLAERLAPAEQRVLDPDAVRRLVHRGRHRDAVAAPLGLGIGGLPVGVCVAARIRRRAQADRRAAGRRPEHRRRVLRADRHQPRRDPAAVLPGDLCSTSRPRASGSASCTVPLVATSPRMRCTPCRRACARRPSVWGRGAKATSMRVVVPAAISGIMAAMIVGPVPRARRDDGGRDRGRWHGRFGVHPEPARTPVRPRPGAMAALATGTRPGQGRRRRRSRPVLRRAPAVRR